MSKPFTLACCCEFQEGYVNPTQEEPRYFGGNIKWLRASDLNDGYVFNTGRFLSEAGYKSAGKSAKMFEKETLAISKSGTIGSLGILKDRMCGNRAVINIRVDSDLADLMYVFYTLKYKKSELVGRAGGSIQKNLYVSALETLALNHEIISEQKKIAAALSALDTKIDCNNRINAELGAMAKTLYDYWFVQFDFPDANGEPYKSSDGKMIYNSTLKREIPAGWKDGSLWEIARYFNGLPMQKHRPKGSEYLPVIKIKEMGEGISDSSEKASPDIPRDAIVDDGDVLFSWSATLDVKIWSQGKGALNQHIFKVTSDRYPKTFYYFELLAYLAHFKMMAEKRKTTMGHITQDHLKQSRICIPPTELLSRAHEQIEPILKKHLLHEKENQHLTQLRDWLLPMLMNGQVTVA